MEEYNTMAVEICDKDNPSIQMVVNADGSINFNLRDEGGIPASVDDSTESLQTIEYEHHEIHSGSSYTASDVQLVDTTTLLWMITTPAGTKYTHIIPSIECSGEFLVTETEGSDYTGGTAIGVINRNRVGTPNVAGIIVTRAPVAGTTLGAVTLRMERVGATAVSGKTTSSGASRGSSEFVLKPATKYIIAVETFADSYVTLRLDWYEHTDKN